MSEIGSPQSQLDQITKLGDEDYVQLSFDFGTRHSSLVLIDQDGVRHILDSWPGEPTYGLDTKLTYCPTVLYDRPPNSLDAEGPGKRLIALAAMREAKANRDWTHYHEDLKNQLKPDKLTTLTTEKRDELTLHIELFLTLLLEHAKEHFNRLHTFVDITRLCQVVLTKPYGWDRTSQNILVSCFKNALRASQFVGPDRDVPIVVLPESEAALYAWMMENKDKVKKDSVIVIADAGAGTLDIVVSRVIDPEAGALATDPLLDPEKCSDLGMDVGSHTMNSLIQDEVKQYLARNPVRGVQLSSAAVEHCAIEAADHFDAEKHMRGALTYYVDTGINDRPVALQIPAQRRDEIMNVVENKIVGRIEDAIRREVAYEDAVAIDNADIIVICVGGYYRNPYLQDKTEKMMRRIKACFPRARHEMPPRPFHDVAEGAAIRAHMILKARLQAIRQGKQHSCPVSLGFCKDVPREEEWLEKMPESVRTDESQWKLDEATNSQYRTILYWFVKAGDKLQETKPTIIAEMHEHSAVKNKEFVTQLDETLYRATSTRADYYRPEDPENAGTSKLYTAQIHTHKWKPNDWVTYCNLTKPQCWYTCTEQWQETWVRNQNPMVPLKLEVVIKNWAIQFNIYCQGEILAHTTIDWGNVGILVEDDQSLEATNARTPCSPPQNHRKTSTVRRVISSDHSLSGHRGRSARNKLTLEVRSSPQNAQRSPLLMISGGRSSSRMPTEKQPRSIQGKRNKGQAKPANALPQGSTLPFVRLTRSQVMRASIRKGKRPLGYDVLPIVEDDELMHEDEQLTYEAEKAAKRRNCGEEMAIQALEQMSRYHNDDEAENEENWEELNV